MLAVLAATLAACEAQPPPATTAQAGAAAPTAQDERAAPGFDVGPVKSAADYLAEPELAAADRMRGQLLSLACAACHTLGAGQKTVVGPNLHGIFGRHAAALPDFDYSPALRASGLVWTPRALDAWLANPQRFVVGTTMTFTGYRDPDDRRALIAYLLEATQ